MKKSAVIMVFIYSLAIYAQTNDSIPSELLDVQKNYLYHLIQLNTGTILGFKKSNLNDLKQRLSLIKNTLIQEKSIIDLRAKNVTNTRFSIREECGSAAIYVNVYFVLFETANNLAKTSGGGNLPNKGPPLSYKWRLEEDVLIFTFVSGINNRLERYIP